MSTEAPEAVDAAVLDPAVRTVRLTKRYGEVFAVRGLSLDIPRGAVFGLIGPNGAGKSTTFSILASLLRPTGGTAEVLGLDPTVDATTLRRSMGFMPDQLGVYPDLRVDEYLEFFAACYDVPRRLWAARVDELLGRVGLAAERHRPAGALSRGMAQRLSLARALVHDPELLLLDEPANGLDPRGRVELRELLGELQAGGKTVVISSHLLSELEEVCTDVGILDQGRLLASGPPAEIRTRLGHARRVRVRFMGGKETFYTVDDEEAQHQLLRELVADYHLPVVQFEEVGTGLEALFLRVTEEEGEPVEGSAWR